MKSLCHTTHWDDKIVIKNCSCLQWRKLVPIIKELFPEISPAKISWILRTYKKNTYIALLDNDIVGFYIYYTISNNPDEVWLDYIGINKKNRNRGIGSLLLISLLDNAITEGFNKVLLSVRKNNIHSTNFYKKNGFKQISETTEQITYCKETDNSNSVKKSFNRKSETSANIINKIYLKILYFFIVVL